MLWSMSTKGTEIRKMWLTLKRRKELRKVLLEYLHAQWMRAMKKDCTFQKVMETQNDLKDMDGSVRIDRTSHR